MHDKINKIIYIILILLIIGLIFLTLYNKLNNKEYVINFDTMEKKATVRLYNVDKTKATKILKEVKNIFDTYSDLTNTKKEMGHNLYYIKNNSSNLEYIDIDSKLYNLIKYGLDWYDKSEGLIDISSGDILDTFDSDITDIEVLKNKKINIDDIYLKDNQIKNNHININLNDIKIGYVVNEVVDYLKQNKIECYYVYVDGLVNVGKHYKDNFGIGLEDPSSKDDIYQVIYGNNITVSTVNYDGSMINLKTYKEADYIYGLSIVGTDIKDTYVISRLAFLNNLEDSKNYIENLQDFEGIWYKFNKDIVMTSKFNKYLKK